MIEKFSLKKDGNKKVAASFHVREFACKDGSDEIYIDFSLTTQLQRIRNWAEAPVTITSGYRTPEWNRKVGGSSSSFHLQGRAADIVVSGKSINAVAAFAEAIGLLGIECNEDRNYVHVDTREKKYFWYRTSGKDKPTKTFGGKRSYQNPEKTVKKGQTGNDVRWVQWWLRLWGYDLVVDSVFGEKTENAVIAFQKRRGIKADGKVGVQTRAALMGF